MRCIFAVVTCLEAFFGRVIRLIGPLMVLVLLSLIGFNTHVYFTVLMPDVVLPSVGTFGAMVNLVIGLWILGNLVFNYLRCVFMSPGHPSADTPMPAEDPDDRYSRSDHIWRWCSRCNAPKPPRAHHCSVCRRCVLKMDHHCPWVRARTRRPHRDSLRGVRAGLARARLTHRVHMPPARARLAPAQTNNCIGHRNYRHFCLFIFYLLIGCVFVLVTASLPTFFSTGLGNYPLRLRYTINYMGMFLVEPGSAAFFQVLLALSAALALSFFVGFHSFLTATGQTTLEFFVNQVDRRDARRNGQQWVNPFDHGLAANCEEVLLAPLCSLRWLLPSARPPANNGMDWDMVNARVSAV